MNRSRQTRKEKRQAAAAKAAKAVQKSTAAAADNKSAANHVNTNSQLSGGAAASSATGGAAASSASGGAAAPATTGGAAASMVGTQSPAKSKARTPVKKASEGAKKSATATPAKLVTSTPKASKSTTSATANYNILVADDEYPSKIYDKSLDCNRSSNEDLSEAGTANTSQSDENVGVTHDSSVRKKLPLDSYSVKLVNTHDLSGGDGPALMFNLVQQMKLMRAELYDIRQHIARLDAQTSVERANMDASLNNITVISQQNITSAVTKVAQGFRPLETKISQLGDRISLQDQLIVTKINDQVAGALSKYTEKEQLNAERDVLRIQATEQDQQLAMLKGHMCAQANLFQDFVDLYRDKAAESRNYKDSVKEIKTLLREQKDDVERLFATVEEYANKTKTHSLEEAGASDNIRRSYEDKSTKMVDALFVNGKESNQKTSEDVALNKMSKDMETLTMAVDNEFRPPRAINNFEKTGTTLKNTCKMIQNTHSNMMMGNRSATAIHKTSIKQEQKVNAHRNSVLGQSALARPSASASKTAPEGLIPGSVAYRAATQGVGELAKVNKDASATTLTSRAGIKSALGLSRQQKPDVSRRWRFSTATGSINGK